MQYTSLTDVSEMTFLLSIEPGYNLSLQVGGESFIQPNLLPCPVGHEVTCPAVWHFMSYYYLNGEDKEDQDADKEKKG